METGHEWAVAATPMEAAPEKVMPQAKVVAPAKARPPAKVAAPEKAMPLAKAVPPAKARPPAKVAALAKLVRCCTDHTLVGRQC